MYLTSDQIPRISGFFVKIRKISEIRVPWRFRTLRSTALREAAPGETFLKLVKLENNSEDASRGYTCVLPPPTPFRAEPQRKWTVWSIQEALLTGLYGLLGRRQTPTNTYNSGTGFVFSSS